MIGRHLLHRSVSLLGARQRQAVETGHTRLLVAGALFAIAFLVIAARLVDLTLFTDGARPSHARAGGDASLRTERADIIDRNGVLLATGLATASLYANPHVVLDAADAADRLARTLPGLDRAKLRAKLESDRGFVWLARHLTPRQQYAVNRLGLPGLDFKREERRVYPNGTLAAHVIGHTDIDNRGLAGVERRLDAELQKRTRPLQLSIDVRVQHVAERELGRAMTEFRATGGAAIVQDVRNGEILTMVSLPQFDPNRPPAGNSDARFARATLGVYEMGSTFKIFTVAMALESGRATLASGYDASQPIRISRFVIRDYHGKRRWLSVPEIFIYSSNIGAAKMALDVGIDAQRAFLDRLGMLRPSPVELTEVGTPLVPGRWRRINTMTIAFGHGLSVSPLQLVSGASAMVNGGVLYAPTVIKRRAGQVPAGKRVISARTSERMRRLLRLVVTHGTGRKAAAPGYLVGGKTGTAEKVRGRGYKSKALLSSFVAAFPMHAPRYVVFAMLDEPTGTARTQGYATGGWVAAPVVSAIIRRIGPLLEVPPVDEDSPEIRRQMAVEIDSREAGKRRLASF
jgi:cell division protein FtsI (penicillin-binding protein 3)